jgi:signal transduction histidine kinase
VVKHAAARHAAVALRADTNQVELSVCDDGRGIHTGRDDGVGLGSMRERAEALGGTLDVTTGVDGGTVVTATVPLPGRGDTP